MKLFLKFLLLQRVFQSSIYICLDFLPTTSQECFPPILKRRHTASKTTPPPPILLPSLSNRPENLAVLLWEEIGDKLSCRERKRSSSFVCKRRKKSHRKTQPAGGWEGQPWNDPIGAWQVNDLSQTPPPKKINQKVHLAGCIDFFNRKENVLVGWASNFSLSLRHAGQKMEFLPGRHIPHKSVLCLTVSLYFCIFFSFPPFRISAFAQGRDCLNKLSLPKLFSSQLSTFLKGANLTDY